MVLKNTFSINHGIYFIVLLTAIACSQTKEEKQVQLYTTYCASCHIAPDIDALPKQLWKDKVLPEMAARLGIRDSTNNPLKRLTMQEQAAVIKTGVYPGSPIIAIDDWELLKKYILDLAPESMPKDTVAHKNKALEQFNPTTLAIDSIKGSHYSYLKYDDASNAIVIGSLRGELLKYDLETQEVARLVRSGSTITDYSTTGAAAYLTNIGFLLPSEIATGSLSIKEGENLNALPENLHRPVNTLVHDFDENGTHEIVVSEFGDLKGQVSLWTKNETATYSRMNIIEQPGFVRVVARDMNKDGKDDMVAMAAQGDEGIYIFYQKENLEFEVKKAIRFSPIYGSSWFELVDYDGDGDDDIITVNGDNADETYVAKPYHGMRLHLNDGQDNFEEVYFYPMNGCTRIVAKDFDQDGDLDMALLSTFPDYENHPEQSFVYLENRDANLFDFQAFTLKDANQGKWFLMDSGDIDNDGDEDLMLSSLTYEYSPMPENLKQRWNNGNVDLLLLENKLK